MLVKKAKYKLLIIAPCINQFDVGEAYVGYKWVQHLADYFDITVLTLCKKGFTPISAELSNINVVSWDEPPIFSKFERLNSMLKPWYPYFYFLCRKWIISSKLDGISFDLGFQITPIAMRYPTPFLGLEIPYAMGPLGGGVDDLPLFAKELKSAPWYTKLRKLDILRLKYDPLLINSFRKANLLLVSAPHIIQKLKNVGIMNASSIILNEHGVELIYDRNNRIGDKTLKLLFVGRVIRTKAIRDVLRALPHLPSSLIYHLDIVGDGEDLIHCKEEIVSFDLQDKVTFHGKLARQLIDSFYQNADIFVFPSFREPTGGVIIEAMSHGLPLIVADYGGPASIVDDSFGIKIFPSSTEEYPKQIAEAIKKLAESNDLREKMSRAAIEKVKNEYLWSNKIKRVADLLVNIIEKNT